MANTLLHAQITAALSCLKTARFDGDEFLIAAAELHLDKLLDRLEVVVPA